jgi:hypothetical protein
MTNTLKSPFPWFGGKSRVAGALWARFGDVRNYVEPFFGSGAALLGRPAFSGPETINDLDGFVANFWRAIKADPDAVAHYADWPVNEADLHARHVWLVGQKSDLLDRLMGDPDFYDAKIAGYWVWGLCAWIGGGFCSGKGPWQSVDGKLVDVRKNPHLGDAGRGVNRKRPHLGSAGHGINRQKYNIYDDFSALSERLRSVRVACGDWSRVLGPSVTTKHAGITGVFLDPPYSGKANRCGDIYAEESLSVAHDVREWALAHGDNPKMRIALCGYEGEHEMPGWSCLPWKARGGYGSQSDKRGRANACRERIWFSPHCVDIEQEAAA